MISIRLIIETIRSVIFIKMDKIKKIMGFKIIHKNMNKNNIKMQYFLIK